MNIPKAMARLGGDQMWRNTSTQSPSEIPKNLTWIIARRADLQYNSGRCHFFGAGSCGWAIVPPSSGRNQLFMPFLLPVAVFAFMRNEASVLSVGPVNISLPVLQA